MIVLELLWEIALFLIEGLEVPLKLLFHLTKWLLYISIWLLALPVILVISPFGAFDYARNFENHFGALQVMRVILGC